MTFANSRGLAPTIASKREPNLNTKATLSFPALQSITQAVLNRDIEWIAPNDGYCDCPGEHLHTHRSGQRHCRVYLDGAPTVYCVHTSCAGVIEEKNRLLRSQISKAERGGSTRPTTFKPSPADLERER